MKTALKNKILAALSKLDPTKDDDWTTSGLPRVERVQTLAEDPALYPSITRDSITEANPTFNRDALEDASSGAGKGTDDAPEKTGDGKAVNEQPETDPNKSADPEKPPIDPPTVSDNPLNGTVGDAPLTGGRGLPTAPPGATPTPDANSSTVTAGVVQTSEVAVDEMDEEYKELQAEIDEAAAEVSGIERQLAEGQRYLRQAQGRHDAAVTKLDRFKADNGRTSTHDIQDWLKSQAALREQKAAKRRRLEDLGVNLADLNGTVPRKSPQPLI